MSFDGNCFLAGTINFEHDIEGNGRMVQHVGSSILDRFSRSLPSPGTHIRHWSVDWRVHVGEFSCF